MKVDKQKFDAVLGRLINSAPQKRSETKPDKKGRAKRATRKRAKKLVFSATRGKQILGDDNEESDHLNGCRRYQG